MTADAWVAAHPYLRPVADLHALVERVSSAATRSTARIPNWDAYAGDFTAGIPLMWSTNAALDLSEAERAVRSVIQDLASTPLPGAMAEQCRALDAELHHPSDPPRQALGALLNSDSYSPAHPGLLRYLGWTVLARYLTPVVRAFDGWRDEDRWHRSYCPTCGAPPAMAQLVGVDPGRLRFLSCGCCGTRWRYRRTACPFCDDQNDRRLAVVAIEGESGLRIDYCDTCRGYLKTYNGQGSEGVLLADWTSLHLDYLARDRGLKRLAASLYDV